MHIKNVIISGFCSYREQSFPDGLSPGANVIVGRNGSGKSNFFAALQFVLSGKYSALRAAERRELLHVGAGRSSLAAFVEVVFDNSDGRLVIPGRAEEAEVRIRRTVGLKQDEFRVNDRRFTAAEIQQLLESAGFSACNPYYIVEQGKITDLVSMTEAQRYQLIREVAGTSVYEQRRGESEQILRDTSAKQSQVDELIRDLDGRLRDLETETSELTQYQATDKEKRCIEYCVFSAELQHAKEGLAALEEEWRKYVGQLGEHEAREDEADAVLASCVQRLSELDADTARLEAERKATEQELSALLGQQAVVELAASDAAGNASRAARERAALQREQAQLEAALATATHNAEDRQRVYAEREREAKEAASELQERRRQVERLQEKRNRTKLFKTKAERDRWINEERARNEAVLAKTAQELARVEDEMATTQQGIDAAERGMAEPGHAGEPAAPRQVEENRQLMAEQLRRRDELSQQRRTLWQTVHEQEAVVQRCDEEAKALRFQLERAVRQDIRQGLLSLREILAEQGGRGELAAHVHGPLIDLIAVEDGFATAAELTAGNALFNIVVDTFDTSAALLELMNRRRKPGRVSFFPLDTCHAQPRDIPTTADSAALFGKVKCDERFRGVVAEVFGRTAVVTTLEAGARVVKELQCDAVTVEGDQLGRKGGVTGGYLDTRRLKLPLYQKEKLVAATLSTERAKLDALCQQVADLEQSIVAVLHAIEELRTASDSYEQDADARIRERRLRDEAVARMRVEHDRLLHTRISLQHSMAGTNALLAQLREEAAEAFRATWSSEEEQSLERLLGEVAALRTRAEALQTDALQLGTETHLVEDTVLHLRRRLAVTQDRIRELGWTERTTLAADLERGVVAKEQTALQARLQAIQQRLESATQERLAVQTRREKLEASRLHAMAGSEERKEMVERTQVQRGLLMQRRDEAVQKLRRLGALTPGERERYAGMSMGRLMHELKLVNDKLQQYSHVNRKAVDQHSALLATRNDLQTQRDCLARELASIHELVRHLDEQRHEAIARTCKQMQFEFEHVFKELVPTADSVAELQLVKASDVSGNTETAVSEEAFCGARILVSFGLGAAMTELEQLSGGQKSLVALALIFAIQRCDAAPFYLFDEIDAALDAEYRAAVARMLKKQSEDCQFIIASFKNEMIEMADKIFGVFFHNKVSRIQSITKDEGLAMLRQAELEDERRRGEAATAVAHS